MKVFGKLNHKNGFRRFRGQTVKGKRFFKYQIAFKTNVFEDKFLGQMFFKTNPFNPNLFQDKFFKTRIKLIFKLKG